MKLFSDGRNRVSSLCARRFTSLEADNLNSSVHDMEGCADAA
jgi:hypothetical protein